MLNPILSYFRNRFSQETNDPKNEKKIPCRIENLKDGAFKMLNKKDESPKINPLESCTLLNADVETWQMFKIFTGQHYS